MIRKGDIRLALAVMLFIISCKSGFSSECLDVGSVSGYSKSVAANTPIRLSDPERRSYYADVLRAQSNLLVIPDKDGILAFSDLQLDNLYNLILSDPSETRWFYGTSQQFRRLIELRRAMFGTAEPGVMAQSAPRNDVDLIEQYLDSQSMAQILQGNWLTDFIPVVRARRATGRLADLWNLEMNLGEHVSLVAAKILWSLHMLPDEGIILRAHFFHSSGRIESSEYKDWLSLLLDIQQKKPGLCKVEVNPRRIWLDPSFVSRYFANFRSDSVHLHGQLQLWPEDSSPRKQLAVLKVLQESLIVESISFSIRGDNVVLREFLVERIVPQLR